ncbi:MAG: DKNYY domain-containing protein [Lachnospiraceae bacterium]|nr:DKNYY domain-containing protein [Lachnospiraceae bacterium]
MGYARILKDKNGRPSGYRECDGEVAFMPQQQSYENIFRRVKIDLDTMEILNHDFIKDKERVYRKGLLLRGITPEGFHVYNGVYIGNHQVIYTPYGDAKIAHPASFEALDDGLRYDRPFPYSYGRDEEFAYFFTGSTDTKHAVRLKACHNPKTFSVLSEQFAKDDKHIYSQDQILKKANPDTFEVLKNYYARDDKHVFFVNRMIEADVKTFIVLEDGYAKDHLHLFCRGNLEF